MSVDQSTMEDDILYFINKLIFAIRIKNKRLIEVTLKRLKQLQDALIIYRLERQPHRTCTKIEVQNLKPGKNKSFISIITNKFKNREVKLS